MPDWHTDCAAQPQFGAPYAFIVYFETLCRARTGHKISLNGHRVVCIPALRVRVVFENEKGVRRGKYAPAMPSFATTVRHDV